MPKNKVQLMVEAYWRFLDKVHKLKLEKLELQSVKRRKEDAQRISELMADIKSNGSNSGGSN